MTMLALLAALPPRTRSLAPILVRVLLLIGALTVRLPPARLTREFDPRLMVAVQVVAPLTRRAPTLLKPVPLRVKAVPTVSPPRTSSVAPAWTVVDPAPRAPLLAMATTPSAIDKV